MSQSSQSSGLSLASLSASASSLLSSVKDLTSSSTDTKEVLVKLFYPETNFYRTFKFEKGAKVEDLLKEVKRTSRTPIEHFEQYGIFVSNPAQKTSICLDAFSLLANHDQNKKKSIAPGTLRNTNSQLSLSHSPSSLHILSPSNSGSGSQFMNSTKPKNLSLTVIFASGSKKKKTVSSDTVVQDFLNDLLVVTGSFAEVSQISNDKKKNEENPGLFKGFSASSPNTSGYWLHLSATFADNGVNEEDILYIKPTPSLSTLIEDNQRKMLQEEVLKIDVKTSASNLGGKPAAAIPISVLQNGGGMVGDIKQYLFQQLQLPSEIISKSFFLDGYEMDDESNFMDEVILRDEYSFLYSDWTKVSLELDSKDVNSVVGKRSTKIFPILVEFSSDSSSKPYSGIIKELSIETDFSLPLESLFQALYSTFVVVPNVPCRFIYSDSQQQHHHHHQLLHTSSNQNITSTAFITTLDLQQSLLEHNILPFSKLTFVRGPTNILMSTAQLSTVTSPSLKQILEEETNIWTEPEDSDLNIRMEAAPLSPSSVTTASTTSTSSSLLIKPTPMTSVVVAGTLNKLVQRLTNEKIHDLLFMKIFILTYQSFTTPEQFLCKLIQRYHVPYEKHSSLSTEDFLKNVQTPIQLRVVNVLKNWMEISFNDFQITSVKQIFDDFVESLPVDTYGKKLKDQMIRLQGGPKQKKSVFRESAPTPKIPRNLNSGNLNFMDVDDEEIARQLTLIDYEYFSAIKPTELLNQAWNKPSLLSRCPNVMASIERFNIVSKWVVSMIVKVENLRTRAKMFSKCISISKHLSKLNNYNGMMAFVAAFNNAGVARLSQTKKEIPSKLFEDFETLEKLMNPESSWKSYRTRIHGADPPLIPYMGLYLSDLTFIEDGNPDMLGHLINFQKRALVYNAIQEMMTYQQMPYNLAPIPKISSLLKKLPAIMEDKELYNLSLKNEPREPSSS